MQEVEVWLFASKLGHLVGTSPDHWSFVMNPREDLGVPLGSDALSLLFPTREGTWEGMQVRQWFQQFLPEPEILRPLCRRLGLSSTNEIALLGALGGDCPGAISFRTPMTEGVIGEGVHRLLSPDELRHLVAALPERPLLVDVEGARYLFPGTRHKIPVFVREDEISLSLGGADTTHILKTSDGDLKDLAQNEWFCMRLAKVAGLNVASVQLHQAYSTTLLVERIDRIRAVDGTIGKVQMEDFCQLWSLEGSQKFEREGGLGVADCVEILRRYSVAPGLDLREFLKWVIFGYLVGFGCGHGKQLTLLHTAQGPRLGPFFGIWSSHVYAQMNERMAMTIGREDRPDWLIASRWKEFARHLGVRPKYVLELLAEFAKVLPPLAVQVFDELGASSKRSPILLGVQELILNRCRQAVIAIATEAT